MSFSPAVETAIRAVAAQRAIDPAALLAIVEVESGGQAVTVIDGRPMPLILFEYHVFHRRLPPEKRQAAIGAGLAARRWGQIPYPRRQKERYALLERARKIDREAAYAACSWGVGQVLGENARWLGYESAEALAEEAMSGVEGQVRLMLRFIDKAGLSEALAARDWATFARGYNGPGYKRHDYDGAMARAYALWRAAPVAEPPAPVLSLGDEGAEVAKIQRLLSALGVLVIADGRFGPLMRSAVLAFQAGAGLPRDGVIDERTRKKLEETARSEPEMLDALDPFDPFYAAGAPEMRPGV